MLLSGVGHFAPGLIARNRRVGACPTFTSPAAVRIGICLIEWVPPLAMGLTGMNSASPKPPSPVLSPRHRLKMQRVDAGPTPAKMIKIQPGRNRPYESDIRHAVRLFWAASQADAPVSSLVLMQVPRPAAIGLPCRRGDQPITHGCCLNQVSPSHGCGS